MKRASKFVLPGLLLVLLAACGPTQPSTVNPSADYQDLPELETTVNPTPDDHDLPEPEITVNPSTDDQDLPELETPGDLLVEEGPFQLQEPNPLRVEPQLDDERAISGVGTVEGGSLTAQAADGAVFTLTIPPDALLSDQAITMTPLLGVEGQELSGGFVAGVNLAPDGLQLFDAATLTIRPAQTIPIENELSFAVHGKDKEVLLYPLLPDAEEATFAITHFSDYYIGEGDATDRQTQTEHPPSKAGDQFLQQMQALVSAERGSNLVAGEGDAGFAERAAALARSYLQQVLLPRIQMAESSDDWRFVCQVIAEVMGFERTVQFLKITDLGIEFDADAALEKLLARQAELLLDYAEALCRDDYVLLGWSYMLRVARTQAIRGISYGVDLQDWQASCRPPKLFFSSQSTNTAYWPYAGDASRLVSDILAEAEVPLRYDPNRAAFVGEGPLELTVLDANSMHGYTGDSGTHYCALSWKPAGSTLRVEKLTINLNQTECDGEQEAEGQAKDPGIKLTMNLGTPSENWSQDCSEINASGAHNLSNDDGMDFHRPWLDIFRLWHRDRLTDDSLTYIEGTGWVFTGPSSLTFTKWLFSPDRSSAHAEIEQFDTVPFCEDCFYVDGVENTKIEIR